MNTSASDTSDPRGARDEGSGSALNWIERLVRIDTTSRNSNLGLIEEVRDSLVHIGLLPHLTYDKSRCKANLFATLPDSQGGVEGGFVLSGHTDVVPVDGQAWDSDPFKPEIRDGRLYGRGACDMKGFIGTVLNLVPQIDSSRLRTPLHIALSYDEEVGCLGAPVMIEDFLERGIRPDGCLVGEPTDMTPVVAHKGINIFKCKVRGSAAHSSLTPRAVNAIEFAARIIMFIRDLAGQFEATGPRDPLFDVPFTTASTGLIMGGIAVNIVPSNCEFFFEYRNLPEADAAEIIRTISAYAQETLLPQMRRRYAGADITFERIAGAPFLQSDEEAAITKRVRRLAKSEAVRKVAYATEGGQFQAAGVPSIVCGPGSIEQAHKANEFVTLEQIAECESFLRGLVATMSEE